MAERSLRGDNRTDAVAAAVSADPEVAIAISKTRHEKMQNSVAAALAETDDRKLAGWVAVAVWEDDTGKMAHSVVGDPNSTFLELKGYLHDGIWAAAHTE